jgi:hypothetical protein
MTLATPLFTDVTILVNGGAGDIGFQSEGFNNTPILDRVRITVSSGTATFAAGIASNASPIIARNTTVVVSAASSIEARAVDNFSFGVFTAVNSSFSASSSSGDVYALYNTGAAATIANCQLRASSAIGHPYGIYNTASGGNYVIRVDSSQIDAIASTVYTATPAHFTVRIGATHLFGGPVVGTATCAGVYDENYNFSPSTCP